MNFNWSTLLRALASFLHLSDITTTVHRVPRMVLQYVQSTAVCTVYHSTLLYTVHYWARVFKISSNFKKKSSNFLNDTFLYTKKNTNRKEHQIKNLMHQHKTQILAGTKKNTKKWKAPTFKPIGTKKKSTLTSRA